MLLSIAKVAGWYQHPQLCLRTFVKMRIKKTRKKIQRKNFFKTVALL